MFALNFLFSTPNLKRECHLMSELANIFSQSLPATKTSSNIKFDKKKMKSIGFQQTSRQPATEHGGTERRRVEETRNSDRTFMDQNHHPNAILQIDSDNYQAICGCGWTSTINFYEHVDLLRAMHAHAAVTFKSHAK